MIGMETILMLKDMTRMVFVAAFTAGATMLYFEIVLPWYRALSSCIA